MYAAKFTRRKEMRGPAARFCYFDGSGLGVPGPTFHKLRRAMLRPQREPLVIVRTWAPWASPCAVAQHRAQRLLQKPFTPDDLMRKVHEVLDGSAASPTNGLGNRVKERGDFNGLADDAGHAALPEPFRRDLLAPAGDQHDGDGRLYLPNVSGHVPA